MGAVAFSVVFFGALYGAPALLARDLVRRLGWGWPSLLVLFAALGVVQACLIDQSLFAADYLDYDGWVENREPTLIAALGISGSNAYSFLVGHLIFSFAAPTALAESWAPRRARTPWLGPVGTVLAVLAYLLAAALILGDPESHSGSAAQLLGAGAVVLVLLVLAALLGSARRRNDAVRHDGAQDHGAFGGGADRRAEETALSGESAQGRDAVGRRIPLWLVVVGGLVAGLVPDFLPPTWGGLALSTAVTAALGAGILLMARRADWTVRHAAAVGLGLLLERGLLAFTYFPLAGEVGAAAKYGHNIVMLVVVLLAGTLVLLPQQHEQQRSH